MADGKIVVKLSLDDSDFEKRIASAGAKAQKAISQKVDAPIVHAEATAAQRAAQFKTAAWYESTKRGNSGPIQYKYSLSEKEGMGEGGMGAAFNARMLAATKAGDAFWAKMEAKASGPGAAGGGAKSLMEKLGSLGSSSSLVSTLKKFGEAFPAVAGFAKDAALATGALVALRVAFGLVGYAVGLVLGPLKRFAHVIEQAAEAGARLYARVLASGGLPTGYVSQVSMAARVGGMSEADVVKFGSSLKELNDMVSVAARTMAENTQQLTSINWQTKAFGENWSALWAQFVAALEPSVAGILDVFNRLLRINQITGLTVVLGQLVNAFLRLFEVIAMWSATLVGLIHLVAQAVADLIHAVVTLSKPDFTKTSEVFNEIKKIWQHQPEPQEQAGMAQRMPASAWERMGLVVGLGPGVNPTAETAKNTRSMVSILKQIESHLMPRTGAASVSLSNSLGAL